jgi:hypothetical protein
MQDKLESLIKIIYRRWRSDAAVPQPAHPDDEALASFIEGKLSEEEAGSIKEHLLLCSDCAESVGLQMKLEALPVEEIPEELKEHYVRLASGGPGLILEIYLKVKEKIVEIIGTTGDVLVGQELVPAPILRSRKIKDFRDEITVLKDFKNIRVEAKIENKNGKEFNLTVLAKDKITQKILKDLRVTLIKDDLELESYLTDSGLVTFEHVLLGKYRIEILTASEKIATVLLDVKA